jgi:hypothetical protein
MKEPDITIGGVPLTVGQAMTVRVALGSFAMSLDEGLGDDEHGRRMTEAYRERLRELFQLMGVSG